MISWSIRVRAWGIQNRWLEEKTFRFPAKRLAYETSKQEEYQGEFIGIRHQFKDYWVFNTTDESQWTDNNLVSAVTSNNSGKIEVVIVDDHSTGITYGGKNNKGYYLYDEGKKIRHDVSEEGRVTLGGIEIHF